MNSVNLLSELNEKILLLEQTINNMRNELSKETSELNEIQITMNELKSKFDNKKFEVNRLEQKINEKSKIANESRMAYSKIIENTSKLLQAVSNEATLNNQ